MNKAFGELDEQNPDDLGGCAAIVYSAFVGLAVMCMVASVVRWLLG